MKIRAKLTLRNEVAVAARESLGLSQLAAADAAGIPQGYVGAIECMRFKGIAEKHISVLAAFYGLDPDVMAPLALRKRSNPFAATIVREVALPVLLDFDTSTPNLIAENPIEEVERELDNERVGELLKAAMDTLTWREREIIKLRYGLDGGAPMELAEVGRIFRVSSTRASQIETKAMRKLMHPSRLTPIAEALDVNHLGNPR